jgi:hypothetical protein
MRIVVFALLAGSFAPHALAFSSFINPDGMSEPHGRRQMPAAPVQMPASSPTTVVGDSPDAEIPDPAARQQRARYNAEQHLQAVADSRRLTQLATELESDLERAGDDTLPSTAVKKADDIAKLAKSVKEKLKSH